MAPTLALGRRICANRVMLTPSRRAFFTRPAAVTSQPQRWLARRRYSEEGHNAVEPPEYLTEGERKVFDLIKDGLKPEMLDVQDISGGCGSMYALNIVSEHFKGLPIIKQHRLVNKVLGDEVKKWHGVQLKTRAP